MKKYLKFSFLIIVMLVTVIFAIPKEDYNVYASEYSYTASIVEDYDTTFLNGITSVESVNFNCIPYYRIDYSPSIAVNFTIDCGGSFSYKSSFDKLYIQLNRWSTIDLNSNCFTSSIMLIGNFKCSYNSSYYHANCTGTLSSVIISDGFLPGDANTSGKLCSISGLPDGMPSSAIQYRNYSTNDINLNQYLDFNSSTNYSYDVFESFNYLYSNTYYNAYRFFTGQDGTSFCFGDLLTCVNKFYINFVSGSNSSGSNLDRSNKSYFIFDFSFNSISNFNYSFQSLGMYIKDFEIKVNRPVYRTENTLVIYNYDYDCAISKIDSVEYALSKDSDLYKAKYTGTVPNSSTIGFICEDLQNRLYDEYIYIYLTFKDNIIDCTNKSCFSLGFDFNFSRFYEPLVIDTSSDFENYGLPGLSKPNHWYDFGGWIMYATIWVMFYNPVVKPLSKVIAPIFSLIVTCVKFLVDFPLGIFITAYIGFIVFYKLIASFMPSFSGKNIVNITTNVLEKQTLSYKDNERIKNEKQELAMYNHNNRYSDYKNGILKQKRKISLQKHKYQWNDYKSGRLKQRRKLSIDRHNRQLQKYKSEKPERDFISSFYDNMIGYDN